MKLEDIMAMHFLDYLQALDYSLKTFVARNMVLMMGSSEGTPNKPKTMNIDWTALNPVSQALKEPKHFSEIPTYNRGDKK